MDKVKDFLKRFKWYEFVMLACFYAVVIVLGIVFKSSWLVIINSVLGITYVFLNAKGLLIANFFGIAQVTVYSVISFLNMYYGEIIVSVISFVIIVSTLIAWFKNKSQDSQTVKIGKKVSWKELLILMLCLGVLYAGMYFILKTFDTQNLIISTFSVVTNIGAGYFLVRRSPISFMFYMLNNFICVVLWLVVAFNGDLSYLPTMANFIIFLVLNIMGIINWARLKKIQANENNVANLEIVEE